MEGGRQEYTLLWFIENYSYCCHKNGEELLSPPFFTNGLEGTHWNLALYPRGKDQDDKGHISVFLFRSPFYDGPEIVSVKFELSFLAADGSPLHSEEFYFEYEKQDECGRGRFLQKVEIFHKRKADYLPQGTLTVRCKLWKGEGSKTGLICARTRIVIKKVHFLFEVEDFKAVTPNEKSSLKVQTYSKKKDFLTSNLYFTYDSNPEESMIVEINPPDGLFLCKRKISLLDGSGNLIGCGEEDNRLGVEIEDITKRPLSLTRQMILSREREYLPDGKLSLFCECVFSKLWVVWKIEETHREIPITIANRENIQELRRKGGSILEKAPYHSSGLEDIKDFYMNQCLTDVQLKTKTKYFPVHKLVLCARSPVFNSMLTSDMEEKHNQCIQIDDLEDEVVQQLLLFLYSDSLRNLEWEMASRLYYAADKYDVGKLKDLCSSFLLANLSPRNAGQLLLLSDTHTDTRLKKSVEEFILEHEKEVFGSEEWEVLLKTHPLLVAVTMHLKYKR